jgi:Ca2+-transporting ATPase
MNKSMMMGIFSGGITLAAVVIAVYFFSWFRTSNIGTAQTYAFVAWLLCHVCLAFNMRTNRVPLTKAGLFSSKAFNIWMIGVIAFLIVSIKVQVVNEYLKLSYIGLVPVLCLALVAIIATSWMEMQKHYFK